MSSNNVNYNSGGGIYIEFSDQNSGANYYWAINEMTIQKGRRIITVSGGIP